MVPEVPVDVFQLRLENVLEVVEQLLPNFVRKGRLDDKLSPNSAREGGGSANQERRAILTRKDEEGSSF